MKILTIKELIEELETYNPSLKVMFTHEGKGHDFPIVKENIAVVESFYCPFGGIENNPDEDEMMLRIGIH